MVYTVGRLRGAGVHAGVGVVTIIPACDTTTARARPRRGRRVAVPIGVGIGVPRSAVGGQLINAAVAIVVGAVADLVSAREGSGVGVIAIIPKGDAAANHAGPSGSGRIAVPVAILVGVPRAAICRQLIKAAVAVVVCSIAAFWSTGEDGRIGVVTVQLTDKAVTIRVYETLCRIWLRTGNDQGQKK